MLLSDVKVGDIALVKYDRAGAGAYEKEKITRVTRTSIHIGLSIYSRVDGRRMTGWSEYECVPFIVEIIKEGDDGLAE